MTSVSCLKQVNKHTTSVKKGLSIDFLKERVNDKCITIDINDEKVFEV